MAWLDEETRTEIARRLEGLERPVSLVLFTNPGDADASGEILELLRELAALSDRLVVEPHDFREAAALAYRYGVERAPGIVVEADRDYGLRYYGAPAGYAFETLVDAILDVSRGTATLPDAVRARLAEIASPVHIQVFSTPT